MKYFIDKQEVTTDKFFFQLENELVTYVHDNYDLFLDEMYPNVIIGDNKFSASTILKNCNPVDYKNRVNNTVGLYFSDYKYKFNWEQQSIINGITFETKQEATA